MTTNYSYNTDGLISKRSNSTESVINVWDGDQLVLELDDNKNVITKYIRAFDDLIKAENVNGTLKWYYVKDAHGNIVKLLDSTYKVTKSYTYDEFGVEKNIDSADANPFRYCGEYYDKYSGTVYLRARSYSPGMGRFMQMDSYAGDYNNPLSLNLWTYCENDGVNHVDPSGHIAIEATIIIVSAAGAVIYVQYSYLQTPAGKKAIHDGAVAIHNGRIIAGKAITSAAKATVNQVKKGAIWVGNKVSSGWKSITSSFSKDKTKSKGAGKTEVKEPASPGNMEKQVEKGQAPKEVDRVDKPHVSGQRPHVHFKDGTSLNNDGTVHDAHKGTPNPSNKTIKWLNDNGWKVK